MLSNRRSTNPLVPRSGSARHIGGAQQPNVASLYSLSEPSCFWQRAAQRSRYDAIG